MKSLTTKPFFSGFGILDLEPGLAFSDDFQFITGMQDADGLGGLGGLHAETGSNLQKVFGQNESRSRVRCADRRRKSLP